MAACSRLVMESAFAVQLQADDLDRGRDGWLSATVLVHRQTGPPPPPATD